MFARRGRGSENRRKISTGPAVQRLRKRCRPREIEDEGGSNLDQVEKLEAPGLTSWGEA